MNKYYRIFEDVEFHCVFSEISQYSKLKSNFFTILSMLKIRRNFPEYVVFCSIWREYPNAEQSPSTQHFHSKHS